MFSENPTNPVKCHPQGQIIYEFGPYRLEVTERNLLRNGKKLALQPKAFELLTFLIERANKVATKEEIFETVWQGSFVEESNLAVHISGLRKLFAETNGSLISIDTVPKVGYRLKIDGDVRAGSTPVRMDLGIKYSPKNDENGKAPLTRFFERPSKPRIWKVFFGGLVAGMIGAAIGFYFFNGQLGSAQTRDGELNKPRKHHSFKTLQCPRDVSTSILMPGGCEEAVASFAVTSNPNGNWSYGYTSKDDLATFVLFRQPLHNNHYYSPEVPVDIWRRAAEEWQPSILRNTSPVTIVIQDGVVVPPHMFEMHPGPEGERSVLRWTAPVDGHFRVQGQFRGINTNGDTTTDVLVVFNGKEIFFSDNVTEYNLERPFEVTFKAVAGDTVDLSVGYGSNQAYECDSTGVSVSITTISLAKGAESRPT